jgi:hypothetical protein
MMWSLRGTCDVSVIFDPNVCENAGVVASTIFDDTYELETFQYLMIVG